MENTDRSKTLLVMVTGFVALYFIFNSKVLLYIALGVGVLSLSIPVVGKGIVYLWFKLAQGLGWLNSKVILSVIYFIVLLPFSMLYKLTSKSMKSMKKSPERSYFTDREHEYVAEDLEELW